MKISCTLLGAGFAALAAMLMTADFADAGGRRGHGGRQGGAPEGHENRAEALGLTEDQTAQMQSLRESFRREAEALKETGAQSVAAENLPHDVLLAHERHCHL